MPLPPAGVFCCGHTESIYLCSPLTPPFLRLAGGPGAMKSSPTRTRSVRGRNTASATDSYAESEVPMGEAEGRPGKGCVAEMCRDWEAATDSARQAGIRVVQIRLPSVLAAHGHSILAAFLPLFRYGVGPVLGSGQRLMCFISCDDLVRAIEHIMACELRPPDRHGRGR